MHAAGSASPVLPMWRRMALVITPTLLVALGLIGWVAVSAVTAQANRDDVERLNDVASGFIPIVQGRLETADAWVRYLSAIDAGTDGQALRGRVQVSGTLSGVVLVPWQQVVSGADRSTHSRDTLPTFDPAGQLALTAGHSVLKVMASDRGAASIYLVHLVDVAGSRQVGFFELAPASLWRGVDQLPSQLALTLVDSSGQIIFESSELPAAVYGLFVRALNDGRNPGPPVPQQWQQGGGAWRAAVKQIDLEPTRIASSGSWGVAAYDRAIDAGPAILTLGPIMLALLLLSGLCVLLAIGYLARRWQPALMRLDAALVALRQGVFEAVDAGGAADAPRVVADSYNRAVAELQRRLVAQGCLAEIDRLLLQAEELEQILEAILLRMRALTGSQVTAVALIDRDAPAHARSFVVSADSSHCPISRVNIDEEIAIELRASSQQLMIPPHHIERYSFLEPLRQCGADHCCVWPILLGEHIAAIVSIGYRGAMPPSDEQASLGAECAVRLQIALANAERSERLYRQAHFDSLTALPNRLLFRDRLSQELRNATDHGQRSALLYVDLDHFKQVNDSVGHIAGDQLLTIVAQRLRACVKEGDTVARLGGDEFTVILRNLPAADAAGFIAERIIEALRRPVNIAGRDHSVRASIGITLFPDDANTIEEVMRNADLAMYQAKDGGRSRAVFFDNKMTRSMSPLAHSGLFRALRRREFALHYQPQFELRSGEVAGLEALLRWQSPREGLRLPKDFIAAAEDSGLIVDIGSWVLESACHQFALWRQHGTAPARLALNLSVQQLRSSDFAQAVRRALETASLPPQMLELEVTEAMFAEQEVRQTLQVLSTLGVRLALDDLGTGYSSLNFLRQHLVDSIKLDRSFLQEVPDSAEASTLVATIIDTAHVLGKQVVAEGVETQQQLEFLCEHGCDFAQGFVLARPLGVAEVSDLLASRRGVERLLRRAAG